MTTARRRRWIVGAVVGGAIGVIGVIGMGAISLLPTPPTDVGTEKRTAGGRYRVRLAPDVTPIPRGRVHRWTASVTPWENAAFIDATRATDPGARTITTVTLDGGMPRHRHGLPTRPRVTNRLPDGRYVIDGVKFSMPGWWELRLRIDGPAGLDSVTYHLNL